MRPPDNGNDWYWSVCPGAVLYLCSGHAAPRTKSYWDSTDAYYTVRLVTVRYGCRRLATYCAVPVSPPHRTPYRPVRNLAAGGEPKPNHTGIVRMHTAQYRSSLYDTGVAAWPHTMQYQCCLLAAHCTDLYGIWLPLCSTTQRSAIPSFPHSRVLCCR